MEYTTNYQLPTWAEEDRIQRTDFNDLTEKLDAALASHGTELATLGNCEVCWRTYTGTGAKGSGGENRQTFPHKPLALFVMDLSEGRSMTAVRGCKRAYTRFYADNHVQITWSGNTVTWSHGDNAYTQLNAPDVQYFLMAIMEVAE